MPVSYSVLSKGRKEAFDKFGSLYQLPIIRSPYDYLRKQFTGGKVLDVGAGADLYVRQLLRLDADSYHSLDNDPDGQFTYRDVKEIPSSRLYDWMVLNQVLEHLTINDTAELLKNLVDHLRPGGMFLATIPNTAHPVRYRTETHVTPWSYTGLYAICTASGYQVQQIYRYNKDRFPLDPFSWLMEKMMRRIYRIDWCDSIMLVATVSEVNQRTQSKE
jgi:SAM-dependent methyltransferase